MVGENHSILEMKEVYANYGLVQVLRGVSLHVKQREIIALIGAHGSGKSATLRAICGLLPVVRGEIVFGDRRIQRTSTEELVGLGIAYVDERRLIFSSMSVLDNLLLGAYRRYGKETRGKIGRDIESVFRLFPVLEERTKQAAGTLSGGEKQMLAIGRAFMSQPKLLLLDCPSLRLAPMLVVKVMSAISQLRDEGVTTLLVEQNVQAVSHIADRGYVMEEGRISAEGDPRGLR